MTDMTTTQQQPNMDIEVVKNRVAPAALPTAPKSPAIMSYDIEGSVLQIADPNIEKMFVEPQSYDGTKIAMLLSRCVIPYQMNILSVPGKIMMRLENEASNAEKMLGIDIVKIFQEVSILTDAVTSMSYGMINKDPVEIFTHRGVKKSEVLIGSFLKSTRDMCKSICGTQKARVSENAYFMDQVLQLQTKNKIDPMMILTPVRNFIRNMNDLSSGLGGYEILALVKVINRVTEFLGDKGIMKYFDATDPVSMLNKLDFMIEPEQMEFHHYLNALMVQVDEIAQKPAILDNDRMGALFNLCIDIMKYFEPKQQ